MVVLLRTVILYIFVTLAIRLMGKRQIGDMQPNELVITLLISEIAAIPLQDATQPVINGIIAIFMLVILEIIISAISMKSLFMRKIMSGKSVIIIKDGEIDQKAMRKVRMTVIDLIELLRGQDVFDISKVAYAVLEVNGNLSVLLKSAYAPATAGDMSIKKPPSGLQLPVISDSKILTESLEELGINESAVKKILKENKVPFERVFLMTLDRQNNYNIIEKETTS